MRTLPLRGAKTVRARVLVVKRFRELLFNICAEEDDSVYVPQKLYKQLRRLSPTLFNCDQQDAHEFTLFLVDTLHEGVRRGTEDKRNAPVDDDSDEEERLLHKMGPEYMAARAWGVHLEKNGSFLVDLFQGQLRSELQCMQCGHVSLRFDPVLYVTLPVPHTSCTLMDCFEEFTATEMLRGHDQWYCSRCKSNVDAKKKMGLWKLPPVLVIHLKRFEYDHIRQRFLKVSTYVKCGLELDLADYVLSQQKDPPVYDKE